MKQIRVLFVDDEPGLVKAVVRRLKLRKIEAVGETSSLDALKRVDEERFDVVILDVRMPDIGGLEVLRSLRQRHPDIEVVLLSGHGSVKNVEDGERLGAYAYLQKPVEIEELVEVIQNAAAAKGGGADE